MGDPTLTIPEEHDLHIFKENSRYEYTDFLRDNNIDFFLGPVSESVAPLSRSIYNWSYTTINSILDFPTLAFKTGLFQHPGIDVWGLYQASYHYSSPYGELTLSEYDPKVSQGAPIGLQLAGMRFRDEEFLAAGETIAVILGLD